MAKPKSQVGCFPVSKDRLKDKVAIVTGAGQGIGRAYAIGFAQESAKIVIPEINYAKAEMVATKIVQNGGDALAVKTDVAEEKSAIQMAETTVAKFGRIAILVNNAAIFYGLERKPFDEISVREWVT